MSRPLTKVLYKRKETIRNLTETVKHSPPIFANLVLSKRVLGAARTIQGEMYKTGRFCQNRCHLRLSSIFKKIIRLDPGGSQPSIRHEPTESPPRLNKTAFTPVRNLVVVTERLLPPAKAGGKRERLLNWNVQQQTLPPKKQTATKFTIPKKGWCFLWGSWKEKKKIHREMVVMTIISRLLLSAFPSSTSLTCPPTNTLPYLGSWNLRLTCRKTAAGLPVYFHLTLLSPKPPLVDGSLCFVRVI